MEKVAKSIAKALVSSFTIGVGVACAALGIRDLLKK